MNVSNTNALANSSINLNSNLTKLSSGSRINSAADDASGMSIADKMSAQVRGLGQAIQNTNNAIGMVQIADGAMQEYSNILNDIRELTLKASNGIMNRSNRSIIQNEIDKLLSSANNIVNTTSYNGINILQEKGEFSFQTGANAGEEIHIDFGNASSILPSVDVLDSSKIEDSLKNIDKALESVGLIMSNLGAGQNALESNVRNISVSRINIASAESQIRDLDFAQESANFNKNKILDQTGVFALAQKNVVQANILKLFQ
ncbi:flagellin [Sulfurimonas sp.]|uniref:flagellin n=1 Tax=Sulfurimonas sp. TaxID=2022749 RepID=UPI002AB05A74|nr:flagellin [Sulfurimonas sp.]